MKLKLDLLNFLPLQFLRSKKVKRPGIWARLLAPIEARLAVAIKQASDHHQAEMFAIYKKLLDLEAKLDKAETDISQRFCPIEVILSEKIQKYYETLDEVHRLITIETGKKH